MGEQVPAASTVAIVVEPGTEDKVGRDCEEEAETPLAFVSDQGRKRKPRTHMMKNQPKKPQWLPLSSGSASAHANPVRHSSRRVWIS